MIKKQKELIQKEIEETSSTRNAQVNWEQTFKPQSFIHLLSDEYCNRIFMKWLSQWKPMLFHVFPPSSFFYFIDT